MLFDAHTHLNFDEYSEGERRTLASEIERSELAYIIDAAYSVESSRQSIKDAEDYGFCYAAVGIHPDRAAKYKAASREESSRLMDADIEAIRQLALHSKAVAIGEIGLDYHYDTDDHDEQQELFRRQIRLANELRMPIMIHSRDAHQLTMDILKEEGAFSDERKSCFPPRPAPGADFNVPDARVQLHCYSGSTEMAAEYVKLGATISLGGPITFKNGRKAAEVARQIPIEYLLSETDAPYLAPEPLRGRPNKPIYIEHVVRRMALLKSMEYEEAAGILYENGIRFFSISLR